MKTIQIEDTWTEHAKSHIEQTYWGKLANIARVVIAGAMLETLAKRKNGKKKENKGKTWLFSLLALEFLLY